MLPYINALLNADKSTEPDKFSCGICDQDYRSDDLINYLKCDKLHYFHQKCLTEYLYDTKLCPYCLTEVKGCC